MVPGVPVEPAPAESVPPGVTAEMGRTLAPATVRLRCVLQLSEEGGTGSRRNQRPSDADGDAGLADDDESRKKTDQTQLFGSRPCCRKNSCHSRMQSSASVSASNVPRPALLVQMMSAWMPFRSLNILSA